MMNPIAIRTSNLCRDFNSVHAVDSISLEIATGTVFGFLGMNGAGKTTTIRLLLGLLEPTGGSAEVLGFDVSTHADDVRQRSGALLENNGLYERLSAEDNLEFYGRIWRMSKSDRLARIKELLTGIGLYDRRKEAVGTVEPRDEAETGRCPDAVPPARAGIPRRADCRSGPSGGCSSPR